MNKRVVFLMVTFALASFLQACTTTGTNTGATYSRGTAVERAR